MAQAEDALEINLTLEKNNTKQIFIFHCALVVVPTKQKGEECGSCFSPDSNFFCGTCASGLDCVKDPNNELLPDAAGRCRQKSGNILFIGNVI